MPVTLPPMGNELVTAVVARCQLVLEAFDRGALGDPRIPEDFGPKLAQGSDEQLNYFTFPISLDFRRSSDQLWTAARRTYEDLGSRTVFDPRAVAAMADTDLATHLGTHRLALQPTRHTHIWATISRKIGSEWGSVRGMLEKHDYDVVRLRESIQKAHKRDFPYLSGPKLFHFWLFILQRNCGVDFVNATHIDLAVDVHIRRASVRLGLLDAGEFDYPADLIASRWREALVSTAIRPSDMNIPLWLWSRAAFTPDLLRDLC